MRIARSTRKLSHSIKEKDLLQADITEETLKEAKIDLGNLNASNSL